LTLPSAEVDLWPEYDHPDMLVIYHLTLPSSVSLPYEMTVRIPSTGNLNAVAARQLDNTLLNIPSTTQVEGNWLLVKFSATTLDVQVEYYDPGLQKNGANRHFVYNWPGDYAVNSLVIQVQQPVDATDMQISPSLGQSQTGSDGLTYYTAEEGAMKVGQSFTITIDYKKPNDNLSGPTVQVQSSAPLTATPTSRFSWTTLLPWALGVLGVLLIVGGGAWYWMTGREKNDSAPRRARRKPTASETRVVTTDSDGGFVYCHNCGKRANPGDRFCRTCGTALRSGG
jgi:zinc-ribbon domain